MKLKNHVKPGDWVYSIVARDRTPYYVLSVSDGKLKLRGFEHSGHYFTLHSFRKVE